MNPRHPLLTLLASGSLLFAGTLLAQNQPAQSMPPPPPQPQTMPQPQAQPQPMPQPMPQPQAQPMPQPQQAAPAPAPQPGQDTARFNSAQGQVTVNSSMPAVKDAGPPPDFATLAGGKAYVTEDDASAYPPLANDFLHASGGAQHLSKAAYARWLKQR
jgi:outer membrane biosynthesis protein TonB